MIITRIRIVNGFYLNDLYKKMEDHILAQSTLKGVYKQE